MGSSVSLAVIAASAALAAVFAPVASAAVPPAPVEECDRMAAHPLDPAKVTPGRGSKEIDLPKATEACREAVKTYPDEARFHYQLGRVLYYAGKKGDALHALYNAVDRGHAQAVFVTGYVISIDETLGKDLCRAGWLWQRSVAMDHPYSWYYLATHALAGDFAACRFDVPRAAIERYAAAFDAYAQTTTVDPEEAKENAAKLKAALAR
jgi:tetratricopeptide (TPR) repeat protein